jgi:cellulose synthase/poly-beta-1,6-N-acetylglucosamine synthase-like glycosyltransferase
VVTARPRVSLIATVLNEGEALCSWLAALASQTLLPDEIVIVDGGSIDGTWRMLNDWRPAVPVTLLRCPGATIAGGRNAAIEFATGDIIAVTDAGTVADVHWLQRLVAALADERADLAAGFFAPSLDTGWQRALAATTLPDVSEIDGERFLPSSRSVAFRHAWFVAGVRYPVWLDYCEDLVWDLMLRRAGARFVFVPDALVEFRVRPTPGAFARQYLRYARGDGKAGLFARRHILRYSMYALALLAARRRRRREMALLGVFGLGYISRPLLRLWRWDRAADIEMIDTVRIASLVPGLRLLGDLAKMWGYPLGLIWRWRRMGGLGWRSCWRRVTPAGQLWRPAALTRKSRRPTTTRDA